MNVSVISITSSHVFPALIALTADLHAACPGRKSGFSVNTVSNFDGSCLGTAMHVCFPVQGSAQAALSGGQNLICLNIFKAKRW